MIVVRSKSGLKYLLFWVNYYMLLRQRLEELNLTVFFLVSRDILKIRMLLDLDPGLTLLF